MAIYEQRRVARMHEVDAAGIVYYARYLEFFVDIYVDFLLSHGVRVADNLRSKTFAAPIVRVEVDYKAPIRFQDEFVVEIAEATLSDKSLTIEYVARSAQDASRLHARCTQTRVFVDPKAFKPIAIPEPIRAAFTQGA